MIKQEQFISAISNLQKQNFIDRTNSQLLQEAFGVNEGFVYNTELLQSAILDLLSIWFDRDDLVHFCYEQNFGKIGEETIESIEDFYLRLIQEKYA